jgi:hypothetical protein
VADRYGLVSDHSLNIPTARKVLDIVWPAVVAWAARHCLAKGHVAEERLHRRSDSCPVDTLRGASNWAAMQPIELLLRNLVGWVQFNHPTEVANCCVILLPVLRDLAKPSECSEIVWVLLEYLQIDLDRLFGALRPASCFAPASKAASWLSGDMVTTCRYYRRPTHRTSAWSPCSVLH